MKDTLPHHNTDKSFDAETAAISADYGTLKDEIKKFTSDTILYVGPRDSNGWWFVGTTEAFWRDYCKINMKIVENLNQSMMNSYCCYVLKMLRLTKMISGSEKPDNYGSRKKLWNECNNHYTRYKMLNAYSDSDPKPIGDRQVFEVYPRLTGGYGIIVDGREPGKYWDEEEYLNDSGKD